MLNIMSPMKARSKHSRIFYWPCIILTIFAIIAIYVRQAILGSAPETPDAESGAIYKLIEHGHTVYLTEKEDEISNFLSYSAGLSLAGGFIMGIIFQFTKR